MRDYHFYEYGMEGGRLSWAMVPARRALRRIMRPWFARQSELLKELGGEVGALGATVQRSVERLDHLHQRLHELSEEVGVAVAVAWDREAVARRLSALEDTVTKLVNGNDAEDPRP